MSTFACSSRLLTMALTRPYRRTVRPNVQRGYIGSGFEWLVLHPAFAGTPGHYVRGFEVIQRDLIRLFDSIEPADINLETYSFRTFEILVRACIEVEANLTAILRENGYTRGNLTMQDFRKVNASHRLSVYRVGLPRWTGANAVRQPFKHWEEVEPGAPLGPPWYRAYNNAKHDRAGNFQRATLGHALDAMSGLVAILSAQFLGEDFSGGASTLLLDGGQPVEPGMEPAVGGVFQVRYPDDWSVDDCYDFDAAALMKEADPFVRFPYGK